MEGVEAAVGEGVFDGRGLCVGVDVSVTGMTSFEGVVGAETVPLVQAP